MLYIVYLVSIVLYLIWGISWNRIVNYVDTITLEFVVLPCILMLFCTRSFPAFGRGFLFAFGKRDYSSRQYRESLSSVKMVMLTSVIFGSVCFVIGTINGICSLEWSSADSIGWFCLNLAVAMISLFYPLLICVILLPVYFLLKKYLTDEETGAVRKD